MEEAGRSRRATVRALILSLLGGTALWRFLTPRAGAGGRAAVSVPEADVPAEGALVLPQHRLAVVREGASFFAIDLTCTHLACTVKATEQGFACPCHGSRFGSGGQVLTGPAPRGLRRLRLDRRGSVLWISRS
jgi:Rieske Fe-S protein